MTDMKIYMADLERSAGSYLVEAQWKLGAFLKPNAAVMQYITPRHAMAVDPKHSTVAVVQPVRKNTFTAVAENIIPLAAEYIYLAQPRKIQLLLNYVRAQEQHITRGSECAHWLGHVLAELADGAVSPETRIRAQSALLAYQADHEAALAAEVA